MPDIKPIKEFDGYFASKDGDIYSKNDGVLRKLKPYINKSGYYIVSIRRHTKILHRLVAKTWIPNPDNLPEINHKNGVRTDNKIENLEWVSRLENTIHSFRFLGRRSPMLGRTGKRSPYAKIVCQIKNGKVIKEFFGTHDVERLLGIKHQNIVICCNNPKKTAGGFHWKYKEETNV